MNRLGFFSFLMVIASIISFLILRGPNEFDDGYYHSRDTFAIGYCICGAIKEVIVGKLGRFIKWRNLGFCIFPSVS